MNLDAYLLVVCFAGILDGISMNFAILQLDALGNHAHVGSGNIFIKVHMINFLLHKLRMGKLAGQLAIVGKQEHTRCVAVQATNGIDTLATSTLNKIHNGLAVLRVIAGSNIILGFVQENINLLLYAHQLVVEQHGI